MKKLLATLLALTLLLCACNGGGETSVESDEGQKDTSVDETTFSEELSGADETDMSENPGGEPLPLDYPKPSDVEAACSYYDLHREDAGADAYVIPQYVENFLTVRDGVFLSDAFSKYDEWEPHEPLSWAGEEIKAYILQFGFLPFLYIESFGGTHCIALFDAHSATVTAADADGDGTEEIIVNMQMGNMDSTMSYYFDYDTVTAKWKCIYGDDEAFIDTWKESDNDPNLVHSDPKTGYIAYGTGFRFKLLDDCMLEVSNVFTDYKETFDYTDRTYNLNAWDEEGKPNDPDPEACWVDSYIHLFAFEDIDGDGVCEVKVTCKTFGFDSWYSGFGEAVCYLKFAPEGGYEVVNAGFTESWNVDRGD